MQYPSRLSRSTRLPGWLSQHLAALRALLVLTVLIGSPTPSPITAVAQLPGLKRHADGSLVTTPATDGRQLAHRAVLHRQGRQAARAVLPVAAVRGRATGYDPTATSASNLGPESVVDTLPDPSVKDDTGTQSLLTQVCSRSKAVGVAGRRRREAAVLHAGRRRRRPRGLPPRRGHRSGHPGGQPEPGVPGDAVRGHLGRRDGGVRDVRRGLQPRAGHPRPRRRPRDPAGARRTPSPPAAAGSTPASAPRTPTSRRRGSPGLAASSVGEVQG